MGRKIPFIKGSLTDETYDLDSAEQLKTLGLETDNRYKIADEYAHYAHCEWAIFEFKGSTLKKAVLQLESTVDRLRNVGRPVHFCIIVMSGTGFSKFDKRLYKRTKEKELHDWNDKPILISGSTPAKIF